MTTFKDKALAQIAALKQGIERLEGHAEYILEVERTIRLRKVLSSGYVDLEELELDIASDKATLYAAVYDYYNSLDELRAQLDK